MVLLPGRQIAKSLTRKFTGLAEDVAVRRVGKGEDAKLRRYAGLGTWSLLLSPPRVSLITALRNGLGFVP